MTPSQRSVLIAFAAGAAGFVLLFALGLDWYVAAILGVALAISAWFTVNYLAPSDAQSEVEDNLKKIDHAAGRIRGLSLRVDDRATAEALQVGCNGVPRMAQIIRSRDAAVALPLSQRSLAYLTDVAAALSDYIDVQDSADPEYLELGRKELRRLADFTTQPDRELSAQKMDDYIDSLTALNMNPPPELT